MNERDAQFYLAYVLEQTAQKQEARKAMAKTIELSPIYTYEQLHLLSVSYKNAISDQRLGIRILDQII